MKRLLLVPLILAFTACNNTTIVEYEPPVVSIMASPQSNIILPGVASTPTTVTITGVAASTARSFEVVVTESHNGSTPREVCRTTKTQFSCSDTVPALAAGDISIVYSYAATATDARGGRSTAITSALIGQLVD